MKGIDTMKVITNKVASRIAHTRIICNQLPDVFTKQDYEALRTLQADALAKYHLQAGPFPTSANDPHILKRWAQAMKREEAAFSFDGLRKDGFLIVVYTETITKEVDWWGCLEDENGNIIKGSYGCHKRTIEIEYPHYRLSENIEDFFAETLDKISNM